MLVVLTTVLFSASLRLGLVARVGAPAQRSTSASASPRARCWAPSAPRTWRCSWRFFDLMLIPFYFLTGMWGSGDRVRATTKLVVYTLVGSFLMLVGRGRHRRARLQRARDAADVRDQLAAGAAAVAHVAGLDLPRLRRRVPGQDAADPVPRLAADGYKSMPIPAVAVFSGVLSKVAAYGFLRIVLPLFPYASAHFQTLMLLIALVSILWATLVAFTTPDARLVVAYSSVAQLGFITLGIFSLQPTGRPGRAAADGQPRASSPRRCSSSSPRSPPAPAARRSSPTWAGSPSGRRCSPRCS